ncbi:TPA: class B sortase [Clostridioides difficile]|nr:class B sortase [Clostridioides difficile]
MNLNTYNKLKSFLSSRKNILILFTLLLIFLFIMIIIVLNSLNNRKKIDINSDSYRNNVRIKVNKDDEFPYMNLDILKLKKKNEDIIGWLRVPSVNIDIPVPQTSNNEFYLTHDIDKKNNDAGWVFLDTRNKLDYIDMNTVLYGHNLKNRQFGLLKQLLKENVHSEKNADLIQFTTIDKQMIFKICSVYITKDNNWSYTETDFENDNRKALFMKSIQEKNIIKKFDRNRLSSGDKIITLSTCFGNLGTNKRLVVHAKLLSIKDVNTR